MDNENNSESISLREIVEKTTRLEEEAKAQLEEDWGDEDACTFDKGYIFQPVYSCETCYQQKGGGEKFGFCYGCSMNCHVDHRVYELFEKRGFRCDCGTPRSGCTCNFTCENTKDDNNTENVYNHNFDGRYCWCNDVYDEEKMVMLMCVMCLDWFHEDCIKKREKITIPDTEDPCDFVCKECMNKCQPIFSHYTHLLLPNTLPAEAGSATTTTSNSDDVAKTTTTTTTTIQSSSVTDTEVNNGNVTTVESVTSVTETPTPTCQLKAHAVAPFYGSIVNGFWKKGWRKEICTCVDCVKLYDDLRVPYLIQDERLDDDDEEEENEENAENSNGNGTEDNKKKKKRDVSLLEASQEAFLRSDLPHQNKINLIEGFSEMKNGLSEYFKQFAETGKEITAEDIHSFFGELTKKRRKKE